MKSHHKFGSQYLVLNVLTKTHRRRRGQPQPKSSGTKKVATRKTVRTEMPNMSDVSPCFSQEIFEKRLCERVLSTTLGSRSTKQASKEVGSLQSVSSKGRRQAVYFALVNTLDEIRTTSTRRTNHLKPHHGAIHVVDMEGAQADNFTPEFAVRLNTCRQKKRHKKQRRQARCQGHRQRYPAE